MQPRILAVAIAAALAAAVAGTALAAGRQQITPTPADQAAARAAVLRQADFQTAAGWSGRRHAPQARELRCANFRPKTSDLALTGAAASTFRNSTLTVTSDARVFRTADMARLSWRRTFAHAGLLACLRQNAARDLQKQGFRLVSLSRLSFPRVAPDATAYRIVGVATADRRLVVDVVVLGKGRTQITLTASSAHEHRGYMTREHRRAARLLAARARA